MNAVLKGVKNNISSTLKQRKYFYKPHCSAGSVILAGQGQVWNLK